MELNLFLQAGRNRWAKEIQFLAKQRKVWGLLIKDCAGNFYNLEPVCPKLSPTDVTDKTLFERSYLVIGLVQICAMNQLYAPTPPPFSRQVFLRFFFIFFFDKCPLVITCSPGCLYRPSTKKILSLQTFHQKNLRNTWRGLLPIGRW